MSILTRTRTSIPTPRTVSSKRPNRDWTATATYLEFLYGFGAAPGVDLGSPKVYSKVDAGPGKTVYRQEFERGMTIANLGEETAEIVLDRPYRTLANAVVTKLTLPGHSAEVLVNQAA
jgi:hypothetical protein